MDCHVAALLAMTWYIMDCFVIASVAKQSIFYFKLCFKKIYRCIEGGSYVSNIILVKDCNAEDCRFEQTVKCVVYIFYVDFLELFGLDTFDKNCA